MSLSPGVKDIFIVLVIPAVQPHYDIVGELCALAPPHPAGAINRAPTDSTSLRSSFLGNSPIVIHALARTSAHENVSSLPLFSGEYHNVVVPQIMWLYRFHKYLGQP